MITGNGIHSSLSILLMILIGYFLTHMGMFKYEVSQLFSRIVINVSLPGLIYSNLIDTFSKDMIIKSGLGVVISITIMIISLVMGRIVGRLLRIDDNRIGLFMSMFALGNTLFVGLPVNISLFGEQSLIYVLLFYMGNTIMFWIFGVYYLRKDKANNIKEIFNWNNIKKILSPPLIAFFVGISIIALDISTPKFILDTSIYIGQLTTPLSLLFIGIIIHSIDIKNIKLDISILAIMGGRFIVSPFIAYLCLKNISLPILMKKVFVLESAMPVMTLIAIVAQAYDAEYEYATVVASISTLASLIVIPLYSIILPIIL